MRRKWIFIAPAAIVGILVVLAIGGWIVQLLWNWLLPSLLGLPQITVWQGLGLLALCRILFGGLGSRGAGRSHARGRMSERFVDRVADRMGDRWDAMTPEERERFRRRIRDRCGFDPSGSENQVQ